MTTTNLRNSFAGQTFFVLVALVVVFFAASAFAQAPAQPGIPIYVIPVGQLAASAAPAPTPAAPAPQCCPDSSAKPTQGPCCAAPLDERLSKAVNELQSAEKAVAPLRGSTSPVSPANGTLPWIMLVVVGLLLVSALVWALTRNRQTAPPVAPPPAPAPAPAPVVPPAQPAPAPPAPAPARARVGTPCPNCAVPKPNLAARFCVGCGHALPVVLFALLLFGFAHSVAMAQVLPAGDYRPVQCPAGVVSPSVCLQPVGAAAVMYYIPPTGNGPSAIVPTAPFVPAAPAAPRRTAAYRPASQPAQLTAADIKAAVIEGFRAATSPVAPAPTAPASAPAAPAATTPAATVAPANLQPIADRLIAVEQKQVQLATAQNALVDRLVGDEAGLKRVGDYVNDVNDLAVKTAAGSIPKMSTHGGNGSPACQAYQAFMRQGGAGNPPKGCK